MKRIEKSLINYFSYLGEKRHKLNIKRKKKKKAKRRKEHDKHLAVILELGRHYTIIELYEKWLSKSLLYIVANEKCNYTNTDLTKYCIDGRFFIPEHFSIIDNPKISYEFIKAVTLVLVNQKYSSVIFDYGKCKKMDLATQVYLDVIIYHFVSFIKICKQKGVKKNIVKRIKGENLTDPEINKAMFSVGSPAIHNKGITFPDIIPYNLCIRSREKIMEPLKIAEKKDIDTTTLADYVLDSLKKLNKTLSPERLDDLCKVIGEVLINSEEHATTMHRYSVGYFIEKNEDNNHFGVFHLVIFNFGHTIYEKFKDPACPNKEIVKKMEALSERYTKGKLFFWKSFEEETLWTLYALQEGVTSVVSNKKRGNGSIQFIESFFNLRGVGESSDDTSKMTILSGNTKIVFDGTYRIQEKNIKGEHFKVMTFNESGKIEGKPDKKFVSFAEDYFPGTLISATILLKEDDLIENEK